MIDHLDTDFFHDYGQATWTDLTRIGECRRAIQEYTNQLSRMRERNANTMDIVQVKIALQGAQWQLKQLQSKFQLCPNTF